MSMLKARESKLKRNFEAKVEKLMGIWIVREWKMPVASKTQAYGYCLLALGGGIAEEEGVGKGSRDL